MLHHVIGASLPVIAVVLGITCAMFGMYLDFRKKRELLQLYHVERMAAIEKGIELPPLPDEYLSGRSGRYSSPARTRRKGLILLFLGIAIALGLWTAGADGDAFWLGLVPIGLGLAFLLAAVFEFRELRQSNGSGPPLPGSGPGPS
jgi:Domain of unknown function (DUF6249)